MKDMDSLEEVESVHPPKLHSVFEVVYTLTIHNCLGQKERS